MELFLTRIRADALPAFKVSVVVTHRLLGLLLFAHEHLGDSLLEHRLCAFIELDSLLSLHLLDDCLSLRANYEIRISYFFDIFLVVLFDVFVRV